MAKLCVFKTHRNDKYATVNLTSVEDKKMSWSAKGLHLYLISRPPNWQIFFDELVSRSTNGIDGLRSLMRELKSNGYLDWRQGKDENNKYATVEYNVYETPTLNSKKIIVEPQPDFPCTGNPLNGNPLNGNPPINNNHINNKQRKKIKSEPKDGSDAPPVSEEKGKKKYYYSNRHMKGSRWIFEKMKVPMPHLLEPNFEAWANDVRLMMEVDKRTDVQIVGVIEWLTTGTDDDAQFWQPNVQCPAKLREKFDRLLTVMENAKKKKENGNGKTNGHDKIFSSEAYRRYRSEDQKGLIPDAAA